MMDRVHGQPRWPEIMSQMKTKKGKINKSNNKNALNLKWKGSCVVLMLHNGMELAFEAFGVISFVKGDTTGNHY